MTGEINRVPQGLLSLLDMKARGQTPRVLAPEVGLSIEAFQLYGLQQRRRTRVVSAAISSATTFPLITIPQTEVWCVLTSSIGRGAVLAAGTTYRFSSYANFVNDDGTFSDHSLCDPLSFTAGEVVQLGSVHPEGLWYGPGTRFGIVCHAVTLGTAATFNYSIDAIALPI